MDDLHLAWNRPSALLRHASVLGLEDVCLRRIGVTAKSHCRRKPESPPDATAFGYRGRICMAYSTFQFPAEGHTIFVKD
jgi:hypothetical protein